ncbi:unnamed protein product [Blepharisma stoltei]|uniref:Uncharacterized protein n=1 Tax=Blepharisma stoltei TaxID=1481888 RepID=A0AAU9JIN5_9CILI|nr:unnamed protein product [Blepharisma stoltei]
MYRISLVFTQKTPKNPKKSQKIPKNPQIGKQKTKNNTKIIHLTAHQQDHQQQPTVLEAEPGIFRRNTD